MSRFRSRGSSGRRRSRLRAWPTRVALGVLLCLAVAAAAGLVIVHHDVSVSREDSQCAIILEPQPHRIGMSYLHEESAAIARARSLCNLAYRVELDAYSAHLASYSTRTWLAPRTGWALEELDAARVPMGIAMGMALLGLLSLGAMARREQVEKRQKAKPQA